MAAQLQRENCINFHILAKLQNISLNRRGIKTKVHSQNNDEWRRVGWVRWWIVVVVSRAQKYLSIWNLRGKMPNMIHIKDISLDVFPSTRVGLNFHWNLNGYLYLPNNNDNDFIRCRTFFQLESHRIRGNFSVYTSLLFIHWKRKTFMRFHTWRMNEVSFI